MDEKAILEQFRRSGEDLAALGLVSTHGGNMSIRHHGTMIITAHFCMLGRLGPGDLVSVPLRQDPDHIDGGASMDAALHQRLYRFTDAGAVIHAHPAHAVALSFDSGKIVPRDLEGAAMLGEIPVVDPGAVFEEAPQLLQVRPAVLVRGHGSYVVGRTLAEALARTSALGLSCRIQWLAGSAGGGE